MKGESTPYAIAQDFSYNGKGWWKWWVWVDASEGDLDKIEYVIYTLHPSFANPVRKVDNRYARFRLNAEGWGGFTLYARLVLKDGSVVTLTYELLLTYNDGESVSKGPTPPSLVTPARLIGLAVNGKEGPVAESVHPDYPQLTLERSIVLSGAGLTRDGATVTTIPLHDDHLVQLVFEDGTDWLCSPDALEELYPGSRIAQRGGEDMLHLPDTVERPQAMRGLFEKVALKVLNLFTRKAAQKGMELLAADLEEKQLGNFRGLVKVTATFDLQSLPPGWAPPTGGAVLLFIHGTNSSSKGSFAELVPTGLWGYITTTYKENTIAFQHETLTKSPLQNAVELIGQLPPGIELHLITHSRGGLVGEILARCGDSDPASTSIGFSETEIAYLTKEGRGQDVACIRQLQDICRQRRFKVTKFVRVACPTGGTTLLSKRLDHFFNISLNLIGFVTGAAANPVYLAMKDLLTAIVDQKNDPAVLPGLEAMRPGSPFIKVLNNQDTSIPRPVVAISGNCRAKTDLKALLILAERLFFFADNDLVVNTQSMYAGSQRKYKLQYFYDEGTDVDHFHYFSNNRTNTAIQYALQSAGEDQINGFTEYFRGGASLALVDVEGRGALLGPQGGQYFTGEPSGKRPIVILLPGIMGSCLTRDEESIWINYLRMMAGTLTQLAIDKPCIRAPAIVETSYKELGDELSAVYDVVTFSFDWRLQPQVAAAQLEAKIETLLAFGQPIKLVAHSLGGVVVRDLMVLYPETWEQLNATAGFRLLFLGSPLRGSFRILNVLLGEDDIIDKLSRLDLMHTKREILEVFDRFPGILGLMPLTRDDGNDFADARIWTELLQAYGDPQWPRPDVPDLRAFGEYRDKVMAAMDGLDLGNAIYIAGQYPDTPCGYRIYTRSDGQELVLLSTAEGDQTVTWDPNIPARMIAAGNVYYVNHSHGELSNSPDMFAGIRELLEKGRTDLFNRNRPAVRGEQHLFKKPQTTDFDLSPEGLRNTLLGMSGARTAVSQSVLPLKVAVTHGDVKYARYPVLAGHFRQDSILYAEKRIDQLLGGQLEERHRLGIYPGAVGSCEIVLTYAEKDFPGVIVIGLGEQDKLTGFDLSVSTEQSVAKYLLLVNGGDKANARQFNDPIGVSSLLIGCGYGGLSIDTVVQAILQGVINANTRVGVLYGEKARLITEVEFIELYQDRALGGYYAIRRVGRDSGGALKIIPAADAIAKQSGARQKVNIDVGRDWWGRITISRDADGKDVVKGMRYSISTGAAREELEDLYTLGGVVDTLIESISLNNRWSEEKACAVFELLIPNAFKVRVRKYGNITWVLDKYTAGYPWELLQHKGEGVRPLCISAGMIRQLTTGDSRINIESVPQDTALVIGDPQLKGFLPQLPGAFEEARTVAAILQEQQYQTRTLLQMEQDAIVTALMSGSYKIIHLAGHGLFDPDPEKPSGMVIGKESFLGTKQIAQMSDTPDLVFVNCCYLGKTDAAAEQYYRSRFKLAANIGTQLIENGVKAVIVAGWAVEDASAHLFANTFYKDLFSGIPFGEAVRRARETVYNADNRYNTWGAYQCYGNPWYQLRPNGRTREVAEYVIAEQAEIDLSNLDSDMRTGDLCDEEALGRLKAISEATDRCGIRTPEITALEARIYKGLNQYPLALEKYQEMLASAEGGYSFTAVEQYCNLQAKLLKNAQEAGKEGAAVLEQKFEALIRQLEALILLSPTGERYNLLASTWKRRCSLYSADPQRMAEAIRRCASNYREAYRIDTTSYGYTNWIEMENLLVAAGWQQWGAPPWIPAVWMIGAAPAMGAMDAAALLPTLQEIGDTLQRMQLDHALRPPAREFWEMVVPANLQLTAWLVNATVADDPLIVKDREEALALAYAGVWQRGGSRDDRMIELQHLTLLSNALNALKMQHWLAARIIALTEALRERIG